MILRALITHFARHRATSRRLRARHLLRSGGRVSMRPRFVPGRLFAVVEAGALSTEFETSLVDAPAEMPVAPQASVQPELQPAPSRVAALLSSPDKRPATGSTTPTAPATPRPVSRQSARAPNAPNAPNAQPASPHRRPTMEELRDTLLQLRARSAQLTPYEAPAASPAPPAKAPTASPEAPVKRMRPPLGRRVEHLPDVVTGDVESISTQFAPFVDESLLDTAADVPLDALSAAPVQSPPLSQVHEDEAIEFGAAPLDATAPLPDATPDAPADTLSPAGAAIAVPAGLEQPEAETLRPPSAETTAAASPPAAAIETPPAQPEPSVADQPESDAPGASRTEAAQVAHEAAVEPVEPPADTSTLLEDMPTLEPTAPPDSQEETLTVNQTDRTQSNRTPPPTSAQESGSADVSPQPQDAPRLGVAQDRPAPQPIADDDTAQVMPPSSHTPEALPAAQFNAPPADMAPISPEPLGAPAPQAEAASPLSPLAALPSSVAPVPLRRTTRRFLHPLLGFDPADARVYRGPQAAQIAEEHQAEAVTSGDQIVFAATHGDDSPRTLAVLAHELTHVARQRLPRFAPPIARTEQAAAFTHDEERLARFVEARVATEAQRRMGGPAAATPTSSMPAGAPLLTAPNAPARSLRPVAPDAGRNGMAAQRPVTAPSATPTRGVPGAQPRREGLPAPWEPLPPWVQAGWREQSAQPVSTPPVVAPMSDGSQQLPAQPAAIAAAPTVIRRAAIDRGLPGRLSPPAALQSLLQPQAAHPEPDLDALAQQVYAILRRRLLDERRRMG